MAKIEHKYRLDLVDTSIKSFYTGIDEIDKEERDKCFLSWRNVKLPITIKDGIVHYWAEGWQKIRGTRLNNLKSITRLTDCNGELIVEEIIWENTGKE